MIPVRLTVTAIDADKGSPSSVSLKQDGVTRQISCRGGLISATGGFNRNPQLRARMLRQPVAEYCPGAPGHTGQLHELLSGLGARHGDDGRDSAFRTPVSVRKRADAKSPSIPAYLIADETALRKYGLGMVRPGRWGRAPFLRDGYLTRAETLPELAAKLGSDQANLVETITRFNQFARTGIDEDFGRGSTDYQRITAGDMKHAPNPCLGPIETPPFYAVRLFPGDIGAATGFVTDESSCALRQDGSRIEKLYACGNDMHSVMGGNYPGPGITLGPAIVFAYVAVRDIASRLS